MAYEKHSWSCGEKITADKMNNLENGIEEALDCCGGGVLTILFACIFDMTPLTGVGPWMNLIRAVTYLAF